MADFQDNLSIFSRVLSLGRRFLMGLSLHLPVPCMIGISMFLMDSQESKGSALQSTAMVVFAVAAVKYAHRHRREMFTYGPPATITLALATLLFCARTSDSISDSIGIIPLFTCTSLLATVNVFAPLSRDLQFLRERFTQLMDLGMEPLNAPSGLKSPYKHLKFHRRRKLSRRIRYKRKIFSQISSEIDYADPFSPASHLDSGDESIALDGASIGTSPSIKALVQQALGDGTADIQPGMVLVSAVQSKRSSSPFNLLDLSSLDPPHFTNHADRSHDYDTEDTRTFQGEVSSGPWTQSEPEL